MIEFGVCCWILVALLGAKLVWPLVAVAGAWLVLALREGRE